MKVNVKKLPKSTVEINVVVEKDKVKKAYDELFKEVVKNAEIKGFRKGQAPEDLVKEKTDVSKLYGDVINVLLQTYYPQALKEQHVHPISNPQVEVKEFDLEKDFEFTATVAVTPEVKVGDYMKKLNEIKEERGKEMKKMNAEKLKKGEKLEHDHVHMTAEDVINAITEVTEVEIADVLLDDETDRLMSRLVNQAQSVGLSLEQYLKSQNKTAEQLRNEYKKISEGNLKAEFALSQLISDKEIKVEESEIDNMIEASGDDRIKQDMNKPEQRLYIKSVLAKNKLIREILSQVDDHHGHDHSDENENTENK